MLGTLQVRGKEYRPAPRMPDRKEGTEEDIFRGPAQGEEWSSVHADERGNQVSASLPYTLLITSSPEIDPPLLSRASGPRERGGLFSLFSHAESQGHQERNMGPGVFQPGSHPGVCFYLLDNEITEAEIQRSLAPGWEREV